MDVVWFVSGLVIGAVVGVLLGYCAACLAILRKTSFKEWEHEHDADEQVTPTTCHNIADPVDGSLFTCSECGEGWELTCGSPEENHLFFCPRCGAKIVNDGGDYDTHE